MPFDHPNYTPPGESCETPTLPDTLHELLAGALVDLEKIEADPRYTVDMGIWHGPMPEDNTCGVCLGGATMAKSLRLRHRVSWDPSDFSEEIEFKLGALDALRTGSVHKAFKSLEYALGRSSADVKYHYLSAGKAEREHEIHHLYRAIPEYHLGPAAWWTAMRTLQVDLTVANI